MLNPRISVTNLCMSWLIAPTNMIDLEALQTWLKHSACLLRILLMDLIDIQFEGSGNTRRRGLKWILNMTVFVHPK